jgi:hypothetical protein
MHDKFQIGFFGHFLFTIRKKRPSGYYDTHFEIEGAMIVDVDEKNVLLRGTDGMSYLVTKNRIKFFEPMMNKPEEAYC